MKAPIRLAIPSGPICLLRMHDTARCWAWGVACLADTVMAQQVLPCAPAPCTSGSDIHSPAAHAEQGSKS